MLTVHDASPFSCLAALPSNIALRTITTHHIHADAGCYVLPDDRAAVYLHRVGSLLCSHARTYCYPCYCVYFCVLDPHSTCQGSNSCVGYTSKSAYPRFGVGRRMLLAQFGYPCIRVLSCCFIAAEYGASTL